jgi:hypothetical protein
MVIKFLDVFEVVGVLEMGIEGPRSILGSGNKGRIIPRGKTIKVLRLQITLRRLTVKQKLKDVIIKLEYVLIIVLLIIHGLVAIDLIVFINLEVRIVVEKELS